MLDVVMEPWLLDQPSQQPETGVLWGWTNVPPVVAVTVVVPHGPICCLYKSSKEIEMAPPTFIGLVKSGPGASSQWHNMYGDRVWQRQDHRLKEL